MKWWLLCREVRQITEQPYTCLLNYSEKKRLMLFSHLARMDASAGARRILKSSSPAWLGKAGRTVGRPHTSCLATMKNNRSSHNLSVEDATKLALDRPLWIKQSYTLNWFKPNSDDDDDVCDVFVAVRMPPTIVKQPIRQKYYRSDDEISLECEATGVPKPTYVWPRFSVWS